MFKQFLTKFTSNIFVQGGFFLTAGSFLTGFMNYIFNLLVAHALGPEGYGEIAALFSYTAVFSLPLGVITTLLIQKIGSAHDMKEYTVAIYQWMLEKIWRWKLLVFLILIIMPFLPWLTNLSPLTAYAIPLMVLLSLFAAFYSGAYQGLHLFSWMTILGIMATAIKLTGAGLVFFGIGSINVVLFFLIFSGIIALILQDYLFRKKIKNTITRAPHIAKRIIHIFKDRQFWYTIGATSSIALLSNVDIIYVKRMFPAGEAGIYSSWSLFAKIILFAIGPLLSMSFIFFSSKKHEKYHQLLFIGLLILFVVIGVGMTFAYGLYNRVLIGLLFGEKFMSVLPYVEWAAIFGTGYVLMIFMNYYYLAKKSKVSLIPTFLFPFYIIALMIYANQIVKVMYLNTAFTFIAVTLFLLVFFKERLVSLFE